MPITRSTCLRFVSRSGLALWWLGIVACGLVGADDDPEVSTAAEPAASATRSAPPAEEPEADDAPTGYRPPTGPHLRAAGEGRSECRIPHSMVPRCHVLRREGQLYFGGPVGARLEIAGQTVTLGPSDRREGRPTGSLAILAQSDAVTSIPFPAEPALSGDLSGLCVESPGRTLARLPLSVRLPGQDEPFAGEWSLGAEDLRSILDGHLARARTSEGELPPATGDAAVVAQGCVGEVRSLSDIRYHAEVETNTRTRRCGRYRNESGETRRILVSMRDLSVTLYEPRTGRRLGRTRLRAPDRPCPSTVRRDRSVTSEVPNPEVRAWVRAQIRD